MCQFSLHDALGTNALVTAVQDSSFGDIMQGVFWTPICFTAERCAQL